MNRKKPLMKNSEKTGFEYRSKNYHYFPAIIFLGYNLLRIVNIIQDIVLHQTCIHHFWEKHVALLKCGTHIDLANQRMRAH